MRERNRTRVAGAILAVASVYLTAVEIVRGAVVSEVSITAAAPARRSIELKRVSFYKVPFVCPAAPQIGCGSASKPLLVELEHSEVVAEAWLNRAGTIMAIVWTEQSKTRDRAKTLKAVLKKREMSVKELTGDARQQAVTDFESAKDWYRGADVDRLSEEEASIIAKRWIGRFREKIILTDEKAKTLEEAFTAVLKRQLTGLTTREETREEMLKIARRLLDEKDVGVLLEAFGRGFRPQEERK